MDNEFQRLHHHEVISVNSETLESFEVATTFKVIQLLQAIKELVGLESPESSLFDTGIDCEVLRFRANGWRKGKVRVTLEFCPDKDDSTLDDLGATSN
ncbi:MAG: KGK domain-containing protein [Calothrix sp. CSU_2_0]|nr:KGK domain-containing protein [Calothrix sp. CSU_2_0]